MKKHLCHQLFGLLLVGWMCLLSPAARAQCTTPTFTQVNNGSCVTGTGKITFTGPGTTATHVYSIDNGVTFFPAMTFDSLFGGTYTLVAKVIATNCVTPAATATLTNPANPAAPTIASSTNVTDCNNPNGSITFSAPAPATTMFSVDNGNSFSPVNTPTITGLEDGVYATVAMNAATGCISGITNRTITLPALTGPVSTLVQPTSCSAPNGQINFTAVAGAVFSIDGGVSFGSAGQTSFTALAAGTYNTLYKNANGCLSAKVVKTLNAPAAPAAPTSTATNITNCTTPNGSITFSAPAPGTNRFSIDGGVTFGAPGVATFNNLPAGTYATMVMSPTTGCVSDSGAEKTIALPTIAAPAATLTQPTNCTTPNGQINFTAVAGASFSINNGVSYGTVNQTAFTGLAGGNYITLYKNANGCLSAKITRTLTNPVAASPASTTINPTSCSSPNGRITFTAVANTVFSVNGGATWGTAGQTIFPSLGPGTYRTMAKLTTSGCVSAVVNKVLTGPAVTAPTATPTALTNCNTPNGKITVTAPSAATYVFSIDNGVTFAAAGVSTFTGLAAGTYKVVAKLKSSGCLSAATSVTIALPAVAAPTGTVTNSGCISNTGVITFTAPAPTATNSFSINGGSTYSSPGSLVFNGLAPGTYVCKVRTNVGCVSAASTTLTVTNTVTTAPTTTLTASNQCNPYNAAITFTAPTTAQHTFSIDSGLTWHPAGDPGFATLPIATYYTMARNNATGCISAAVAKTTTASNPILTLTPTFTKTNVTTCATPNGKITFTGFSNGSTNIAGEEFSIDSGLTWSAAGASVFSNLAPGSYYLQMRNPPTTSNGCPTKVVATAITKPAQAGTDKTICLNQYTAMTATALSGATWTAAPGNPTPAPVIASPNIATTSITGFKTAGTYSFIWANSNCSDTVNVIVNNCASSWGCPSTAFLFKSDATFTDMLSVNLGTGGQTTIRHNYETPGTNSINGIGYNVTDDEIWGSYIDTTGASTAIAQIGADLKVHLYNIKGLDPGGFNVGTVDANGILYLYASNDTKIYRVDVNPNSPTYLTLRTPILNTTAISVADFAFNPMDGFLYGVDAVGTSPNYTHRLLKINPNTGNVITVGTVTATPAATWGAAAFGACYFDALGNLYVANNTAGGVYKIGRVQNVTGNTTAVLRSQGQPSGGNDGALCHNACIKPDAGRDTVACMNFGADLLANATSGSQWLPVPGNPGTITFADDKDANTHIDFSVPGTYYVIWTDGGTCNDTVAVNVSLQPLTPVGAATTPTCTDQAATVTISQPTGPNLMYTMDDNGLPQGSPVFTNVAAGDHIFIAMDTVTACTSNPPAAITVAAPPSVPNAPATATGGTLSCASPTTSITITAPTGNVVYSFDGGLTYQVSNVKNNFGNGSYNVMAKDNTSGCPSDPTIVTIDPPALGRDFGDLVTGTWPVASVVVPSCQFTNNAPSAYNGTSNPFVIVWAGNQINTEAATVNGGNTTANSDSYDDGVGFPALTPVGGVASQYTVTANANTPTTAYYRLWYDWNDDGDFSNDVDGNGDPATYAGSIAANGPVSTSVDVIPPAGFQQRYKVRMVMTDLSNTSNGVVPDFYRNDVGGGPTPTAVIALTNGEVEDYNAEVVALPLNLLSFTAKKAGNSADLNWVTTNEQNIAQFVVERSGDSKQWNTIGTLKAAGAGTSSRSYHLADNHPFNGINYYRLRIVTLNGDYKFSETRQVAFSGLGNTMTLAPNPSTGHTTLRYAEPLSEEARLKVWNSVGLLILDQQVPAGTTTHDLDLSNEAKGIYHISVNGAGINEQAKLILK